MAWAGLKKRFDFGGRKDGLHTEPPSAERVRAVVERNDLLRGDRNAIEAILANGHLEQYAKGHKLITQDDQDDDVFIIILGSVRVLVGAQHCDTREASQVVGEMAAGSPNYSRTANVIVDQGGATVLRVPGDLLRSILAASPEIMVRYKDRFEEVARQNMKLMSRPVKRTALSWWVISLGVGLTAGVITFAVALSFDWSSLHPLVIATGGGLFAFTAMMFMGIPQRLFSLCIAAGIGIILFVTTMSLPEGSLVVSPDWAPGIKIDLAFGRNLNPVQQIMGLISLCVVFFGAWRMHREAVEMESKR